MKCVKEFVEGDKIKTQLLVSSCARCLNNNGSAYLNIELRDCSGTIQCKKWEVASDDEEIAKVGNVLDVEMDILKYREALQGKIHTMALVDKDDIDTTRFVKNAPIALDELKQKLITHLNTIKDHDYLNIVNYFLNKYNDKFYLYPAASSIHHEYQSGLLMHVTTMLDLASKIEPLYDGIDHNLLFAGIILHDIGKIHELEGPVVFHYSLEGKLLGHISIMVGEIREAADSLKLNNEKALLLEHIVLSHHGQKDYGSPVEPLTIEAMLVHLIDNLDSKMTILTKALETTKKGEFTQKIFALDSRQFYKH